MSFKAPIIFVLLLFIVCVNSNEDLEIFADNPYHVLKIAPWSSMETIKKKYNELVKKFHPDKKFGSSEKFRKIQSAYEKVKDLRKNDEESEPYGILVNLFIEFLTYYFVYLLVFICLYYFFYGLFKFFEYTWRLYVCMGISFLFIDKFFTHLFSEIGNQYLFSIMLGFFLMYFRKISDMIKKIFGGENTKIKST